MTDDPFAALGLPGQPDLADEQVRAAWRAIAAATHPDRPDGGDARRYIAAASAYAQLRTPWGRSEAYADLTAATESATVPLPVVGTADFGPGASPARPLGAIWLVPARIRHGRPLRLALRAMAATVLALLAVRAVPGQPAGPAVVTGIITWFLLTARADLAPPPGR
jgi:hypothetical protein